MEIGKSKEFKIFIEKLEYSWKSHQKIFRVKGGESIIAIYKLIYAINWFMMRNLKYLKKIE